MTNLDTFKEEKSIPLQKLFSPEYWQGLSIEDKEKAFSEMPNTTPEATANFLKIIKSKSEDQSARPEDTPAIYESMLNSYAARIHEKNTPTKKKRPQERVSAEQLNDTSFMIDGVELGIAKGEQVTQSEDPADIQKYQAFTNALLAKRKEPISQPAESYTVNEITPQISKKDGKPYVRIKGRTSEGQNFILSIKELQNSTPQIITLNGQEMKPGQEVPSGIIEIVNEVAKKNRQVTSTAWTFDRARKEKGKVLFYFSDGTNTLRVTQENLEEQKEISEKERLDNELDTLEQEPLSPERIEFYEGLFNSMYDFEGVDEKNEPIDESRLLETTNITSESTEELPLNNKEVVDEEKEENLSNTQKEEVILNSENEPTQPSPENIKMESITYNNGILGEEIKKLIIENSPQGVNRTVEGVSVVSSSNDEILITVTQKEGRFKITSTLPMMNTDNGPVIATERSTTKIDDTNVLDQILNIGKTEVSAPEKSAAYQDQLISVMENLTQHLQQKENVDPDTTQLQISNGLVTMNSK